MIAYTTIGTNDYEAANKFYGELFLTIGIKQIWANERFTGYGTGMDSPMFAVCKPFDGQSASAGNGTMIALSAPDKDSVHKLHAKAIELGASCDGEPGPRGDTGFYCGYFKDLDGNKLNIFAMVPPAG
ncbi:MAG: VOC family protein [Robiginitomaculum sp.]